MDKSKTSPWKYAVTLVAVVLGASLGLTFIPASQAEAISGSDFRADYIISDANFFDYQSMSASDIQNFVDGKVARCTAAYGIPCLESYRESTYSRPAVNPSHCSAYAGANNELASTIIYKVAQSCRISPKVLLVLLQKEQGLVTSSSPTASAYRIATGYGCPDTAACDSAYYGFYNQVYRAAWQFRQYTYSPGGWRYKIGNTAVQFHPNAGCGATTVNIKNQATANLYNYTPYQPNQAALNNLYGTGDGCSSYGNRNFWTYYWGWFGDPTGNSGPFGIIDGVGGNPGGVSFDGWAIDPDTADPISIRVFVDNVVKFEGLANQNRPDLAVAFPEKGANHGFSGTITGLSTEAHTICIVAINVSFGADYTLGCRDVPVFSGSALGVIDSATAVPGSITVTGWMLDPDTIDPITVRVSVDGQLKATVTANGEKAGLNKAFPGYGDNHLFSTTVSGLPGGRHTVCAVGVNVGAGSDSGPVCQVVTMPTGPPLGVIDSTSTLPGSITVTGWMLDPDTVDPITVRMLVDGQVKATVTANGKKADLNKAFPGYGDNHLYTVTASSLSGGSHQVCLVGVNVGPGSDSSPVCRTVVIPTGPPLGVIDSTYASPGRISVTGWMLDPDTIGPIQVKVLVDNQLKTTVTADGLKVGLGESFPGFGDNHLYNATVTGLSGGRHTICVVGINVGFGSDSGAVCKVVDMPTGPPFGIIDSVSTQPGTIIVTGWMLDPDIAEPIQVRVLVDGEVRGTVTADGFKPQLDKSFPGYGDNHLYMATVKGDWTGRHEVCVVGVNVAGGSDSWPVCTSVDMPSGPPFGVFDSITMGTGSISITGWAIDPDIAGPVSILVKLDGVTVGTYLADKVKAGLDVTFPGYGDNHLYQATITGVAPGVRQLCGYIPNVGLPSGDGYIGCYLVTVP